MSPEKIIRMPKKYLNKWLKALRSGGYEQARGTLYEDGCFCCLGVLQDCITGGVEYHDDGSVCGLPSLEWLTDYGITFEISRNKIKVTPYLPSLGMSASQANDLGESFLTIADAIEQAAEAY